MYKKSFRAMVGVLALAASLGIAGTSFAEGQSNSGLSKDRLQLTPTQETRVDLILTACNDGIILAFREGLAENAPFQVPDATGKMNVVSAEQFTAFVSERTLACLGFIAPHDPILKDIITTSDAPSSSGEPVPPVPADPAAPSSPKEPVPSPEPEHAAPPGPFQAAT